MENLIHILVTVPFGIFVRQEIKKIVTKDRLIRRLTYLPELARQNVIQRNYSWFLLILIVFVLAIWAKDKTSLIVAGSATGIVISEILPFRRRGFFIPTAIWGFSLWGATLVLLFVSEPYKYIIVLALLGISMLSLKFSRPIRRRV
jgi:uncharacterized membrane protein